MRYERFLVRCRVLRHPDGLRLDYLQLLGGRLIYHGSAPYLECSTAGNLKFSAFYATLKSHQGRTIEEVYQASKVFEDGSTNLFWREAKGRKPVNYGYTRQLYSSLWDQYIKENPDLIPVLLAANGLSDQYGQVGHCCQATELWRIRRFYQGISVLGMI